MAKTTPRVAIVGAGWSGLSAALILVRQRPNIALTVFEANKIPGGRARRIQYKQQIWDNGQHLLITAYHQTIKMMESVGRPIKDYCDLLPLQWSIHQGMGFHCSNRLPWPLALCHGLASMEGLSWKERRYLFTQMLGLYRLLCCPDFSSWTVAQWFYPIRHSRLWQEFWSPLCWATLNTEPRQASIHCLFEVIRASFFQPFERQYLLVPKTDLSDLFPEPAIEELRQQGKDIYLGRPIKQLYIDHRGVWLNEECFDQVILAVAPWQISTLWAGAPPQLNQIKSAPIATVFAHFQEELPPSVPNLLGQSGKPSPAWDWQIRRGTHQLAWVKSGGSLRSEDLHWPTLGLNPPLFVTHIIEKRATFLSTPQRPILDQVYAQGRLLLTGDYLHPRLPSTLEAAVSMGISTANCLLNLTQQ
jgi:hypothetical protein